MSEAAIRQVLILARIPAAPKKTSTQEIADYLNSYGILVTQRTIQRDIAQLGSYFGIDRTDGDGRGREGCGWTRVLPLTPSFDSLLRSCRQLERSNSSFADYPESINAFRENERTQHTASNAATNPSPARHLW